MDNNKTPTNMGEYKVGNKKPPLERRFGQPNGNPRNNHGAWKKADTPRFKLEQMMKMTDDELLAIVKDNDAPRFEQRLAKIMHDGNWKEYAEMINQVYGQPKATNETVISGELTQKNNPYEGFTKEELKELLKK